MKKNKRMLPRKMLAGSLLCSALTLQGFAAAQGQEMRASAPQTVFAAELSALASSGTGTHYVYNEPARGGGPGEALQESAAAPGSIAAGGMTNGTEETTGTTSGALPGENGTASAPGEGKTAAGTQSQNPQDNGNAGDVQLIDPSGNVSTGSTGVDNTDFSLTKESGQVKADSILNLTPFLHVQMLLSNKQLTDGFTTNMDSFQSPEEGFAGLKIRLENGVGDVYYRVYTDAHGWSKWAMNEMNTPYEGDGAKVSAVQIRIKGYTRNLYDVYYRATLNDGSVLDWAHDGQTAGSMGTGQYIQSLQVSLWSHGMRYWQNTANHMRAEQYEGVVKAEDGSVRYETFNGEPFTGWAYDTDNNKYYFKENIPLTGWQYLDGYKYYFDEKGVLVTDLEPIIGLQKEYRLALNKDMKTLTVYAKDGDNGFIMPVKVILTTVGPATPLGTYKTYEKYRWKFMHDNIYCQYLARFYNGFLLHSAIYEDKADAHHFNAGTYNYMGKIQSDGCVRMVAGDAAWIYDNCKIGTQIKIYNDAWVMGPFDRPAIEQAIPMDQDYDPTDPAVL